MRLMRNKETGVVFPWTEILATLSHMEVYEPTLSVTPVIEDPVDEQELLYATIREAVTMLKPEDYTKATKINPIPQPNVNVVSDMINQRITREDITNALSRG